MLALITELSAFLTPQRAVAAPALVLGAALVLAGLIRLVLRERELRGSTDSPHSAVPRAPRPGAADRDPGTSPSRERGRWKDYVVPALILLVVALAGAWLRIHDIDAKTLKHTEAMLPNLAWPPDSWPPARHSFYETFWWHYHSELHPPAHYLLMWVWTNLFGTSLTSLRLPSALFGVGTILVSYRIGALLQNRPVGLLAAAFVAFNGFHIFNSQYARVNMMGVFLALLSTLAILHLMRGGGRRGWWEVTYVLAAWIGVYTFSFLWVVLAVQMAWVALQTDRPERFVRRVAGLQALVVMLGAAALAHQLYQGAPTTYPVATLAFVVDYLLLGFALMPDVASIPPRSLPAPLYGLFAACAIFIVGAGTYRWLGGAEGAAAPGGGQERETAEGPEPGFGGELRAGPLRMVAVGSALVTLGFVTVALRRQAEMSGTVALPFLALGLPLLYSRLRSVIGLTTTTRRRHAWLVRLGRPTSLILLLAFLPSAALFLLSLHSSVLNPRGLMLFSSYLLIVAAAGAWVVGRHRLVSLPLVLALFALHVASVIQWQGHPSESRDYRALAELMNERMQPGDLLFAVPEEYFITPLYFYLADEEYRYVTRDYADAVSTNAEARVWLVYLESFQWGTYRTTTEEMTRALEGFRLEAEVEALRARAELFVRDPG
jgi:4-amino-4-deoxy-L-arabinose transferase-like glycosyltransferase